jgi:hypothetical protein
MYRSPLYVESSTSTVESGDAAAIMQTSA